MIFGNVHCLQDVLTWLPSPLRMALSYLRDTNFETLPAGRHDVQGDDIYAVLMDVTTKPTADNKPEVHRKYIDIQFVVHGQEGIGVAVDRGNNKASENFLDERDVLFYSGMEGESNLVLRSGDFAVLFPTDAHRPLCQVDGPESVRKVVMKVRASLL